MDYAPDSLGKTIKIKFYPNEMVYSISSKNRLLRNHVVSVINKNNNNYYKLDSGEVVFEDVLLTLSEAQDRLRAINIKLLGYYDKQLDFFGI